MLAVMVLYFPPRPAKKDGARLYRDTCHSLLTWAKSEYAKIPQRYTPIICMDLNAGLCRRPDTDVVGEYGATNFTDLGSTMHDWLALVGMSAINTFSPCGYTFAGNNGTSQIDYVCIPTGARPLVSWTATWHRTAQEKRS